MSSLGWSNDAHRRHKAGASAQAAHRARARRQAERMETGPYQIGELIVIPSEWYSEAAKSFWSSIGAQWAPKHPHGPSWVLNTTFSTYGDKHWPASAWMESIRRTFYEFWPHVRTGEKKHE